jgi:predicted N-acyltransferase
VGAPRAEIQPGSETSTSGAPRDQLNLKVSLITSMSSVSKEEWEACHDSSNPFLCWDFFSSLEDSGSAVSAEFYVRL